MPAEHTLKIFKKYPPQSTGISNVIQTHEALSKTFMDEYSFEVPETFVESKAYKQFMGNVNWLLEKNKSKVVFLVGPSSSGTSAAMRRLNHSFKAAEVNSVKYFDYNHSSATTKNPSPIDDFDNWWSNTDFSDTEIILLDNLPVGIFNWFENFSEPLDDLTSRSNDEVLLIISMNKIMLTYLREKSFDYEPTVFGEVPSVIQFPRADPHEIKELVMKRINSSFENSKKPFSNEIIEIISNLSLGLPGLALWFCRSALQFQNRWNKSDQFFHFLEHIGLFPTLKLVRTISSDGSSIFGADSWPYINDLRKMKFTSIKSSDNENARTSFLLSQYLSYNKGLIKDFNRPYASIRIQLLRKLALTSVESNPVSRSSLKPLFISEKDDNPLEVERVQESKLTYHTQKLVDEKTLKLWKSGKETLYSLRRPMKEAIELSLFP